MNKNKLIYKKLGPLLGKILDYFDKNNMWECEQNQ